MRSNRHKPPGIRSPKLPLRGSASNMVRAGKSLYGTASLPPEVSELIYKTCSLAAGHPAATAMLTAAMQDMYSKLQSLDAKDAGSLDCSPRSPAFSASPGDERIVSPRPRHLYQDPSFTDLPSAPRTPSPTTSSARRRFLTRAAEDDCGTAQYHICDWEASTPPFFDQHYKHLTMIALQPKDPLRCKESNQEVEMDEALNLGMPPLCFEGLDFMLDGPQSESRASTAFSRPGDDIVAEEDEYEDYIFEESEHSCYSSDNDSSHQVKKSKRKRLSSHDTKLDDAKMIGKQIEVYWPEDVSWYVGVLVSQDPSERYTIVYSDGEVENILLEEEEWRFTS